MSDWPVHATLVVLAVLAVAVLVRVLMEVQ
jgi:hypothetical protein